MALQEALSDVYSKHRPLLSYWRIADDDVDGSTQQWAVPSGWENGFSVVNNVEYPGGETPPDYIEDEDFKIFYDSENEAWYLRFLLYTPGEGESAVVSYTARHTLTADLNTVPDSDFYILCNMAAERLCLQLATEYSQNTDSTIGADTVNGTGTKNNFTDIAKLFRTRWTDALGIKDDGSPSGACYFDDWDLERGIDGGELMFHGRKTR